MPTDARDWPDRSVRRVPRWLVVLAIVLFGCRVGVEAVRLSTPAEVFRPESSGLVRLMPLELAEQESLATGKPILYEFSAEWCGPCKRLQREVFSDSETAALLNERFVAVSVVDRMQEEGRNAPAVGVLLERYRVRAFPTIVVVRGGIETARIEGYPGLEAIRERLCEAAER